MIVIRESEARSRAWSDPLIDIQLDEYRQCAKRVSVISDQANPHRTEQLVSLAEHLCDMSRELVYRLNRVTEEELARLVQEFSSSVEAFKDLAVDDAAAESRIGQYVQHIQTRIDMLQQISLS